jgi:hypothetical protein
MLPEWKKVGVLSKFYQTNLRERDHWENLGEDGRKILEWTLKTSILGIGLVRFRIAIFGESLVNVALNFRVP